MDFPCPRWASPRARSADSFLPSLRASWDPPGNVILCSRLFPAAGDNSDLEALFGWGMNHPLSGRGRSLRRPAPRRWTRFCAINSFSMLQPVSGKAQPTLHRPPCLWHPKAPARGTAARCANSAWMETGRECWWYRDHREWSNLLLKIATPILQFSETNQRLQKPVQHRKAFVSRGS